MPRAVATEGDIRDLPGQTPSQGESREPTAYRLERLGAGLALRMGPDSPAVAVRPIWLRPLTARGKEVSLVDASKHEVLLIPDISILSEEQRTLLVEVLEQRYLIPRVLRIVSLKPRYGLYYWVVETDMGRRDFAMKDPAGAISAAGSLAIILRDTMGNRYEMPNPERLDPKSRSLFDNTI